MTLPTLEKPRGGLEQEKPLRLADAVEIAEGGVVSRQLLKRAGGNLTLFAMQAGQSIEEHTSPYDAAVVVLEGRVELTIGGRPVTASQGEAVLMPAGVPHALAAAEDFKMLLVMLRDGR